MKGWLRGLLGASRRARSSGSPKLAPRSFADVPDVVLAFCLHHRSDDIDDVPSPVIFTFTGMGTVNGVSNLNRIMAGEDMTIGDLDRNAKHLFEERPEGDWQALVFEGHMVEGSTRRDAFTVCARDNTSGKRVDVIRPFAVEGGKRWLGPAHVLSEDRRTGFASDGARARADRGRDLGAVPVRRERRSRRGGLTRGAGAWGTRTVRPWSLRTPACSAGTRCPPRSARPGRP